MTTNKLIKLASRLESKYGLIKTALIKDLSNKEKNIIDNINGVSKTLLSIDPKLKESGLIIQYRSPNSYRFLDSQSNEIHISDEIYTRYILDRIIDLSLEFLNRKINIGDWETIVEIPPHK
jgi:hypothetical protein